MHKIEQLIIRTLCTVQPSLKHYLNIPNKAQYNCGEMTNNPGQVNSMCFEILGFDVLIDEKLKPWLIEINHAPSFATDTPLDFKMKKDVIADTLQLLGMTYKRKKKFIKSHKAYINKRMLNAKKIIKDTPKPLSKKIVEPLSGIKVRLPDENDEEELPKVENKKKGDESDSCGEEDQDEQREEYTNQFKLIYPTERNSEFDYFQFLKHAHRLYE